MKSKTPNTTNQEQTKGAYRGAPEPFTNPRLPEPFEVPATDPRDREMEVLS